MKKRKHLHLKLQPVKFGLACGIISGVIVFIMMLFSNYFPISTMLMLDIYGHFGVDLTILGSILAGIYAFIGGFVFTWIFALIYNWMLH